MRYCFVTDGEGHNFLIPHTLKAAFHESLANGEADWYAEFNNTYGQYAIDSLTNWTFADPKENA